MKELTKTLQTEKDMLAFGMQLSKVIHRGATIFLQGPLGSGKTTLTRGLLRGFGYYDKVKSPTYTLVEPYEMDEFKVFHFDFYRLNDACELKYIGIQEYFSSTSICLIEWAEKGFPLLPKPDLACYIDFVDAGRIIQTKACSERGESWLENI